MPEYARPVDDALVQAVIAVRAAVVKQPSLADEEWSSLTKHVGELAICRQFDLLRAVSNDSVVDAVIRTNGEAEFKFDPQDAATLERLSEIGIQVKCRRKKDGGHWGTTGNVSLTSPFHLLYAVWVDHDYRVAEAYSLTRDQVVRIIQGRKSGPNKRKIPRAKARSVGQRLALADLAEELA